jgi:predicted nucleic acid-binding protein
LNQIPRPAIVLDTNVVLDWLLFADPSAAPVAAAIEQRQVRWIATPAMRNELADVLARGLAVRRDADPARLLGTWDAHAETLPAPAPERPPNALVLHCTDPDDQKFIDLALATGAPWLLSRDRAVLRLSKRAARVGLAITTPEGWSAPT